jgi:large subunit ribosomal protein L10
MDNPRPEKVAVVEEVRERLGASSGSVVTEYRGLSVAELAALRLSLSTVGGDYKIFKNTLVRLAVTGSEHEPLTALLTGPTAIAFVHGDLGAVAKALRDFSRTSPSLVMKGGLIEGKFISLGELTVLADLPSREVLLSRLAGAFAAPLRQFGGLLEALPRNLAYGLSALLDQRRASEPAPPVAASTQVEEPTQSEAPAPESIDGSEEQGGVASESSAAEAPVVETPAAEATEVPVAEATEVPVAEATEVPAAETPAAEATEAAAAEATEVPAAETPAAEATEAAAAEAPAAEAEVTEAPAGEAPATEESKPPAGADGEEAG